MAAYVGGWTRLTDTRPVVSPATGETLATVADASPADLDRAVEAARAAQADWAARPAEERAGVLRRAAALVETHRDVLERWLADEAGSARGKAAFEVGLVVDELHQAAATALVPYGQLLVRVVPGCLWRAAGRSGSSG